MDTKLPIEAPFVAVVWKDASGCSHVEYSPDEIANVHKASPYITFGFKVADDSVGITLFNEQALDEKGLRGRAFIPRGMVDGVIEGNELVKLLGLWPKMKRKPRIVKTIEPTT
jgi:hypothetical protein